ncbi:MAG: hypothetical protein D6750_10565 [Bacteroidetes bacterium]|nr:MAG: hypothetical protein D6750_10565 [Bacteroidota bacterium]
MYEGYTKVYEGVRRCTKYTKVYDVYDRMPPPGGLEVGALLVRLLVVVRPLVRPCRRLVLVCAWCAWR